MSEGLVDRLVPWGMVRGMPLVDLEYYRQLTEGTPTSFWPHLSITGDGGGRSSLEYRRDALEYYDVGARGLAMWDLLNFDGRNVKGQLLRRLGHIEELRADVAARKDEQPVSQNLEMLGDLCISEWSAPATHRETLVAEHYDRHLMWWAG